MLQKPVSTREDDVVAAGCLLAESGLALIASVLDERELRRSAYDLLDSVDDQGPSDDRAAVGLIRERLGRLLEACAARGRQEEVQRILAQEFRRVQDRMRAPRSLDG